MIQMFERKKNRLKSYNYSSPGYYFVTICTQDRKQDFGEIAGGQMCLNHIGKVVGQCWKEIPNHYEGIALDEYVIMPNHLHGIVIFKEVPATGRRYSLSGVISSFKNVVSKYIHQAGYLQFAWQHSFYDHVIRKDESLEKIRKYIQNNPFKWEIDRNNPENLWM